MENDKASGKPLPPSVEAVYTELFSTLESNPAIAKAVTDRLKQSLIALQKTDEQALRDALFGPASTKIV